MFVRCTRGCGDFGGTGHHSEERGRDGLLREETDRLAVPVCDGGASAAQSAFRRGDSAGSIQAFIDAPI